MSIHYFEVIPNGFPDDMDEIIEKFDETELEPNRHEHFTKEELNNLLDLCQLAERDADRRFGVDGFSLISDDRNCIKEMLAEKNNKKYPFANPKGVRVSEEF